MLGLGDQERRARTSQSRWFLGRWAGGTQSPCSRQTTSTLRRAKLQAIAPPAAPAPMIRTSRSSSWATTHFLLESHFAPARRHVPHPSQQAFVERLQLAAGEGHLIPPARLPLQHVEDARVGVIGLIAEITHHRKGVQRTVRLERAQHLRLLSPSRLGEPAAKEFLR